MAPFLDGSSRISLGGLFSWALARARQVRHDFKLRQALSAAHRKTHQGFPIDFVAPRGGIHACADARSAPARVTPSRSGYQRPCCPGGALVPKRRRGERDAL